MDNTESAIWQCETGSVRFCSFSVMKICDIFELVDFSMNWLSATIHFWVYSSSYSPIIFSLSTSRIWLFMSQPSPVQELLLVALDRRSMHGSQFAHMKIIAKEITYKTVYSWYFLYVTAVHPKKLENWMVASRKFFTSETITRWNVAPCSSFGCLLVVSTFL